MINHIDHTEKFAVLPLNILTKKLLKVITVAKMKVIQ